MKSPGVKFPKNHVQVQKEKANFVFAGLPPPQNVQLGIAFRTVTAKKRTLESLMHVQSCCFAYFKPLAF